MLELNVPPEKLESILNYDGMPVTADTILRQLKQGIEGQSKTLSHQNIHRIRIIINLFLDIRHAKKMKLGFINQIMKGGFRVCAPAADTIVSMPPSSPLVMK